MNSHCQRLKYFVFSSFILPVGTIFGDPHFVSFDGSGYTFNGLGEFHIVSADNPQIELQGRMDETMKDGKYSTHNLPSIHCI